MLDKVEIMLRDSAGSTLPVYFDVYDNSLSRKWLTALNSILDKKGVLKNYEDLKEILKYTYDDSIVYSVTSKNYIKFKKNDKKVKLKIINEYNSLIKLLNDLSIRKITGDTALLYIYNYIKKYKEYESIILNILDKNLKIRINIKLINSVFPMLIKEFNVALANKFQKKYIEKDDKKWFISRKLDGIRCLCHIDIKNKKVLFYSRQGKIFNTLNKLRDEILKNIKNFNENCFLDGEIVDMKDNVENFKGIMEKIRKKNYTIQNPNYYVFDIINENDFYEQKSKEIFEERYKRLNIVKEIKYISILEQYEYNEKLMEQFIESSKENNWEGLMLRKNVKYEGKRTNNLLKFKEMQDDEYKVIDLEYGNIRYINQETGLEEEIETLSAVIIDYNNTKVGSGFSINERKDFYLNKDKILNKIITVKYFEKTKDSLRFPVFKGVHGLERLT